VNDFKESETKRFKSTELSQDNWSKVRKDLSFIDFVTTRAREEGFRVVISGGYSTDGNIGQITRPHNDIDIQVYGSDSTPQIIQKLTDEVKEKGEFSELKLKDKGRQEYYHTLFIEGNGLGADIYYVRVTGNPFAMTKVVVKNDGSTTEEHAFNTNNVSLEGVCFEATTPEEQLNDIQEKRKRGYKVKPRHDQDIVNLELLRKVGVIPRSVK